MTDQQRPPGAAVVDGDGEPVEPSTGDAVPTGDPSVDGRVSELEDQLRRALADLDNFRKRFQRELVRERDAERATAAADWLPIVDDLERALEHGGTNTSSVMDGVRAVHEHALGLLERLGFPRFDDIGRPFDPTRHEAMGAVEADAPKGTIVAAVRPGYGTQDQILRPAGVVVAKGPS